MTGHSIRTGYLLTDTNFYKGSGLRLHIFYVISACSDLVKQGDYSASSGTCKVGHPRVSLILATVCTLGSANRLTGLLIMRSLNFSCLRKSLMSS